MYLDLLEPVLQTTATPMTLIQAWFVLKTFEVVFPSDKHNTFQTPLISPWKIVSNTASLPTGTSSVILSEAVVFILSCFSLLEPLSWGGQAFPHLLALLEVCSNSCIGWEAANTWVWSAISVLFFLSYFIHPAFHLPFTVSHKAENPLFPHLPPWCAPALLLSQVLMCDRVSVLGLLLAGFPLKLVCEAPQRHHIPLKAQMLHNQRWFILFGPVQP